MPEDEPRLLKIRLHDRGEDGETPWVEDLGPAFGTEGGRLVRLDNVPFLHAKPTYGDVICVEPDPDMGGMLSWNRDGRDYDAVVDSLVEDSGRWALVFEYRLRDPGADVNAAFRAIVDVAKAADIVAEGSSAPHDDKPGRIYMAAPANLGVDDILQLLESSEFPVSLWLTHPVDDDE
jgi:hypothetical protein